MQKLKTFKIIENSFLNLISNRKLALQVILSVLPLMILLDFLMFIWLGPSSENPFETYKDKIIPLLLLSLLITIPWIQMVWSWHRIYLVNPDKSEAHFIPFKMNRPQFQFMMKGGLLWLTFILTLITAAAIAFSIAGLLYYFAFGKPDESAIEGALSVLGALALITGLIASALVSSRISLYFPAKAVGDYISFRRSYKLMRGLAWKLLMADIIIIIAAQIISSIYLAITPDLHTNMDDPLGTKLTQYAMDMPGRVFLSMVVALACVSNLSQTYTWVKKNRMME